jgi:hypothetical protein
MTTPGLGTLGLKFVGFLGLLIVFVCLSNWINTKVAPAHPNSLANLFGAAALLAGWLAWQSVMYRTGSISKRRKRSSNQPKKRPCCALNRARKIWRSRLHNLFMRRRPRCQDCQRIVEPGDRVGQSEQVKRMSRLLHQVLRPEIIIPLMDELETDDRAPLSMVIGQMQDGHRANAGSARNVRTRFRCRALGRQYRGGLVGIHRYIALFDADLGEGLCSRLSAAV